MVFTTVSGLRLIDSRLKNQVRLGDSAYEREHEDDVGEAHLLAHASHRAALQREALGIGRMRVTRGATKAEHRVALGRLEAYGFARGGRKAARAVQDTAR